jgi:hypothetical protein
LQSRTDNSIVRDLLLQITQRTLNCNMNRAVVSAITIATMWLGLNSASADIGPIDPAREICMGADQGSPCVFEGKKGTCEGPHPSRYYCTPSKDTAAPAPAVIDGSAAAPIKPAPTPVTTKPGGCKSGCSGSNGGDVTTLVTIMTAVAALVFISRKRRPIH